jgi:hypothetical protein
MPEPNALNAEQQEKQTVWSQAIAANPPRVRFSEDLRDGLATKAKSFDHIEFMMFTLEHHPLIPFDKYSFGSDLLDFRRGVAYEIVLRLLAHVRNFVANINVRNRPGAGAALRCMLDIYALLVYLSAENRLQDKLLLENFLIGQSFATGADYWLKKEWLKDGQPETWASTKDILEHWIGLPRTGLITKVAHSLDEGFSALYARYSEYVHFVFSQPRMEIEEAFGHTEEMVFGSEEYFRSGQIDGAPLEVLSTDLDACSFILQMTWPSLFAVDPFLADDPEMQSRNT